MTFYFIASLMMQNLKYTSVVLGKRNEEGGAGQTLCCNQTVRNFLWMPFYMSILIS